MCCVSRKGAVRRRAKVFCWVCYAEWALKERNKFQSSVQLAPRLLGANWDVLPLGLNTGDSIARPLAPKGRIWELGSLTSIMGGKISVVAASDTGIATVPRRLACKHGHIMNCPPYREPTNSVSRLHVLSFWQKLRSQLSFLQMTGRIQSWCG